MITGVGKEEVGYEGGVMFLDVNDEIQQQLKAFMFPSQEKKNL